MKQLFEPAIASTMKDKLNEKVSGRRGFPAMGLSAAGLGKVALATIGYDGPISPEPFSRKLNDMDNEQAGRVSGEAMRNTVVLLG